MRNQFFKKQLTVFAVIAFALLLSTQSTSAESIDLIKKGKIVAVATALNDEGDSEEFKKRLFRLTLIINEALSALSGDIVLTNDQFGSLPNRIRLRVVPKFDRDAYIIAVEKVDDYMEIRIGGNTIEHTERAVHVFLLKYLNEDQITELETFVDRVTSKDESEKNFPRPVFKKKKNLVFSQQEAEIREVVK